MLNIGVLASGRGSNFQSIIDAVEAGKISASVRILIVDNPAAFALERAKKHGIEALVILPSKYPSKDAYFVAVAEELKRREIGLVALAGYMRIVRQPLLDAFPMKVMNIHPALLPSFPGLHGQKQALEHGARISGCTVHFVDDGMDTGPIIIQASVPVSPDDTEDELSARILKLEHKIYPEAIRLFAEGRLSVVGRTVKIAGYELRDEFIVSPPLA